jgi:hypothetical protein
MGAQEIAQFAPLLRGQDRHGSIYTRISALLLPV